MHKGIRTTIIALAVSAGLALVLAAADAHEALSSVIGPRALGGLALFGVIGLAGALWVLARPDCKAESVGPSRPDPAEALARKSLDLIPEPWAVISRDFHVVMANEAYATRYGRTPSDIIGTVCHRSIKGLETPCPGCPVQRTIEHGGPITADRSSVRPDGTVVWEETCTWPVESPEGGVITHVIEHTRDVSDRLRVEDEKRQILVRIEHISRHDYLTGLLNRRALIERLQYEFGRSERYGTPLTLLHIDIRNLSHINSSLGHSAGDFTVMAIADALVRNTRRTDIFGRYGGDEFLAVIPLNDIKAAEEFARRIIKTATENPISVPEEAEPLVPGLNIGIASYAEGMKGVDDILRLAQESLAEAKAAGPGAIRVAQKA